MEVSNTILQIISSFIEADLRVAAPILIAAIGLLYMEKAGVVNIGAEGTMLIGALAGSIGAYLFQNPWMGALVAALAGGLVGVMFAYLVVTVKANQIVAGIAINILALGGTTTVNRIFFGLNASSSDIPSFTKVAIPLLSKIPVIGSLFNQLGLAYLAILMVPFTYYLMKKTTIGLSIRSVGEHPESADTAGINVFRIRYGTIIIGSMIIGVAGAYLSVGLLSFFSENMVSGRGYIALASVIFGKWNAFGVLGATLLFGFGDALQIRMQAIGSAIPYQFLLMLPYLLTVAALSGFVGKAVAPKASGKPYFKG
ncbi:MAG: ABC transporter permease [Spirochaetales bacterium]|nr:ABC transporter permease [Spirochaetales bacterium]